MTEKRIISESIKEVHRVEDKYNRPYASAHEFYGVLKEEVEELWDEIKKKEEQYDINAQKKEAIQCIAVLIRYLKNL